MNRDLGVWTYEDCALVLIDYQKESSRSIRSETDADLVELHVRLSGQDRQGVRRADRAVDRRGRVRLQQPDATRDPRPSLDDIEPIDRSSMNSFEDEAFREAVKATGRKRLIFGGLHTEICLAFAASRH